MMVMYTTQKRHANQREQQGFVSLVVALTLVIILALLTVGFAHLSRQNQQRALDKQLSIQANYAAEIGINDATKAVSQNLISGPPTNNCLTSPPLPAHSKDINKGANVTSTCVLVNTQPNFQGGTLSSGGPGQTLVFSTTNPPNKLMITWGSLDTSQTNFPVSPNTIKFPPFAGWPAAPGVLQFQITPYANIDRTSLIANAFTAYLYPSKPPADTYNYFTGIGGGGAGGVGPQDGPILSGGCNTSTDPNYPCGVTLTGLDTYPGFGTFFTGPYLVHVVDYYGTQPTHFQITGVDSGGNPISFVNGQVLIDATGKAQDVVKRLQVLRQVNTAATGTISPSLPLPDYTIEAQNFCKRMTTDPTTPTKFFDPNGSQSTGDPCQLSP